MIAELGEPELKGMPPGPGGEDDPALSHPHLVGLHDLVVQLVLEHSVLVNAGGVSEGVAPDHRLVGLDRDAGVSRDQRAHLGEARRLDAGAQAEGLLPRAQDHDDFFERGIAGPLADAVDGAFDPPGSVQDRGDAIRRR